MGKIKNCERCGKEFEDKRRDGKRFCSKTCAAFYRAAVYVNGMTGKIAESNPNWKGGKKVRVCPNCNNEFVSKHYGEVTFCSKQCRARYGADQKIDDEKRKRITHGITCQQCGKVFKTRVSRKFCSRECFFKSDAFLGTQWKRSRGRKMSEPVRQAMSERAAKRNAETVYTHGKSGFYDSKKAGKVYYRSSYELKAYELLDSDIKVISFTPEPFHIEYTNDEGNTRHYRPDILINLKSGKKKLVEVKPLWKLSQASTQLKINAGKKYAMKNGMGWQVWTEKELGI